MNKIERFYGKQKFTIEDGDNYLKEILEENENVKQTIEQLINGISMEYSQTVENSLSNYARLIETPANLTMKNIKISAVEKNPEEDERKKPLKV